MKKLKVFYSIRMTSEMEKEDTINLMNQEINDAISKWVKKEKITNYEIVNSQLTSTSEFTLFGQFNASMIVLSTHISYKED